MNWFKRLSSSAITRDHRGPGSSQARKLTPAATFLAALMTCSSVFSCHAVISMALISDDYVNTDGYVYVDDQEGDNHPVYPHQNAQYPSHISVLSNSTGNEYLEVNGSLNPVLRTVNSEDDPYFSVTTYGYANDVPFYDTNAAGGDAIRRVFACCDHPGKSGCVPCPPPRCCKIHGHKVCPCPFASGKDITMYEVKDAESRYNYRLFFRLGPDPYGTQKSLMRIQRGHGEVWRTVPLSTAHATQIKVVGTDGPVTLSFDIRGRLVGRECLSPVDLSIGQYDDCSRRFEYHNWRFLGVGDINKPSALGSLQFVN